MTHAFLAGPAGARPRSVRIAAVMILVVLVALAAAVVRGEIEARRLRAEIEAARSDRSLRGLVDRQTSGPRPWFFGSSPAVPADRD